MEEATPPVLLAAMSLPFILSRVYASHSKGRSEV